MAVRNGLDVLVYITNLRVKGAEVMITPIKALNICDLMKRENDLLISVDDFKRIAKNERENVIHKISNEIDRLNSQGGGIDDLKFFLDELNE